MLKKVIMPTLGLDMEGATIQKWLKAEGEEVAKDELILVIETDKATTEITAPASGVLETDRPAGRRVRPSHRDGVSGNWRCRGSAGCNSHRARCSGSSHGNIRRPKPNTRLTCRSAYSP